MLLCDICQRSGQYCLRSRVCLYVQRLPLHGMAGVVAMLVGAAVSLVLMFTKKAGWANAVIAVADFVAFLYYVYGIYFYVSVVMVGIQATGFNSQFRVCTAMFAVLQVLNLVNVFLKQVKEEA